MKGGKDRPLRACCPHWADWALPHIQVALQSFNEPLCRGQIACGQQGEDPIAVHVVSRIL